MKNAVSALLTILFLLGSNRSIASTVVQGPKAVELKKLGAALTKISGEECAAVEAAGSGFALDTVRCLPAPLRRLICKGPEIYGPNCFNLSNMTSGLQPFVRFVSETESDFYTDPLAGYCTEVKRAPEPGDFVMVIGKAQGLTTQIHSYIFLTEEFAITKNGPKETDLWKIGPTQEIRELYMSPSNFAGSAKSHSIERVFYKCAQKGEAKDPIIRALSESLTGFGQAMEAPMLAKPITRKMMNEISQSFLKLKKAFDAKSIAAIRKTSDRYEGIRPLLEVYSHFAALKHIDVEEKGRFENEAAVKAYKNFREDYVAFAKDLIQKTDSIDWVSDDLR